jgi:Zn-dependent protease with chaperone function
VFITEPLLRLCGHDEAEIAFFLGHEMAHVLCGHAKNQLTASTFLNAVTGGLSGSGLLLRQVLAKGYARDLELEADREGARLVIAAGFDPGAAARGLRRLEQASGQSMESMEFFSSHPPLADRVRALEKAL